MTFLWIFLAVFAVVLWTLARAGSTYDDEGNGPNPRSDEREGGKDE